MYRKWLVATMLVCSTSPSGANAETIEVIVKETTSSYFRMMMAGACEAGRARGVTVHISGAQSERDISGQISVLENAVSKKPDAVVIAPSSFEALGPVID